MRVNTNICNAYELLPSRFRSCSYGGGLAQLGGLAKLGGLAPLTNSYKNIMRLYEKCIIPPKWDLSWFFQYPTEVRWIFFIWIRVGGPAWQSGIEMSVMRTYIFCFGILSRFDFNMATTNTTMNTARKINKESPYKQTPKTPWFFINFWLFLYIFF